ncbi:MAG: folylpolyglutamate synthase/dihydrofolate synthase family protein [Bacteroidales bacterium]
MNYSETIEYLYSQLPVYHRIGKAAYKANLDNTIALDNHFGNPHQSFRSIHVAGTNGKGSVSHMLASVLQEAGYKTGLYTSPHLRDYRERIRVNGAMIAEEEVVRFVEENRLILEKIKPSFFEMSVAMAFNYFRKEKIDIAVIETGLGGRLDSTNIINPLVSVITNIGFDHMELLGDTLQKIAMEKAGIIKKGVPVIIGERSEETAPVFMRAAADSGSELVFADSEFSFSWVERDPASASSSFRLTKCSNDFHADGITPLSGEYQSKNIVTVVSVLEKLHYTLDFGWDSILAGIRNTVINTGLTGRWQVLGSNPLVICDTGHNSHGLRYVMKQLGSISRGKLHMVVGFVNDKDLDSVFPLFPRDALYYFTRASVPRAMDQDLLKERAGKAGLNGKSFRDVTSAVHAAREAANPSDVIFIGGSTFVVAEVV